MRLLTLSLLLLAATFGHAAAPLRDQVWQLHHPDWSHMEATIRRALEFGVTEIQLSHNIVSAVDEVVDDPTKRDLVNKTISLCDSLGLRVFVWAKELNIGTKRINTDLDPQGGGQAMWEARRAAYRKAFELCPGLAGVVLQFGSCPTEPWEISDGASAFNANTPCPDRIALITGIVKEVCDAHGKHLDVRDFNHSVAQQQCMRDGFQRISGVRAMIKEVPQDWQVYYPLNPMIGDAGPNENLIEFDLGAEYWGTGKVPFALVDYLSQRIRAMVPRGIVGVVVRAERGNDPALGTPNELNLYAMSRLVRDPMIAPDVIYADWMQARYGLAPNSDAARVLTLAFRDSFDAGRKMFYVLGHWALEKGSEIPDAPRADCLHFKALPQWDPAWKADWQALTIPKPETLARIWQEKAEAIELATRARDAVASLQAALRPQDFAQLQQQFNDLVDCARVWQRVCDATFRAMPWKRSEEDLLLLEGDARALEALAEARGESLPLAPARRIRAFVEDLRKRFPAQTEGRDPQLNIVSAVQITREERGTVVVRFRTAEPVIGRVDYGISLPTLPQTVRGSAPATDHELALNDVPDGALLYVRSGSDSLMSGDYRFIRP